MPPPLLLSPLEAEPAFQERDSEAEYQFPSQGVLDLAVKQRFVLPQYHFLAFFLVILGLFCPPSHLQTCNLPNRLSTITPALHRGDSSMEQLPKIKEYSSQPPLPGQICRPCSLRSSPPPLDSYRIFLSILTPGPFSIVLCVISFFLSPPPSSQFPPSSPPQADFCAQRCCTLPSSRLFTANSSFPTLNIRVPCPSPCPGVPRLFLPGHDPLLTDQEAPLQGISSKQSN